MSSQDSLDLLKIRLPTELLSILKDKDSGQAPELPKDLEDGGVFVKKLPPQMPQNKNTQKTVR